MSDKPPKRDPVQSVSIERRGGFAGLHASAQHDYAALTSGQQKALDGLLSATPVTAAPPATPGPDRFSYKIQVRHADGGERLLDVPEDAMPGALAGLVKPTLP